MGVAAAALIVHGPAMSTARKPGPSGTAIGPEYGPGCSSTVTGPAAERALTVMAAAVGASSTSAVGTASVYDTTSGCTPLAGAAAPRAIALDGRWMRIVQSPSAVTARDENGPAEPMR